MNSILRAQQRESAWPFEVYDCDISPMPGASMPKSPDHRIRRSRSSSQHTIDIVPTFENPCRPCRSSPRPSKSSSSCCHKFKAISPYLSMACFIAILVWEICSLHSEVYKLRYAESFRRLGTPSNSATYLRRIKQDNEGRNIRRGMGSSDLYSFGDADSREKEGYQTVTSTPRPPSHLSSRTFSMPSSGTTQDVLNIGEEADRGDIIGTADDDGVDGGGRNRKYDSPIDNTLVSQDRIELENIQSLSENRIAVLDNPKPRRSSEMEDQLAALMATRDLLKSERRKRPSSSSVPLSKIT